MHTGDVHDGQCVRAAGAGDRDAGAAIHFQKFRCSVRSARRRAGIQVIVNKHAATAALAQRHDIEHLNAGAIAALRGKGMIINQADTSGIRKALGAFYARWKNVYFTKAWSLLEASVGKLV